MLREVVIVGATEARDMTLPGPEGVYVVGSGATGVAEAFILIGLIYLAVMLIAAFSYRLPRRDGSLMAGRHPTRTLATS